VDGNVKDGRTPAYVGDLERRMAELPVQRYVWGSSAGPEVSELETVRRE